ncbi:SWIM zinc finger family protein [Paenibacillus sanguinis]|uniref:SWIM zinc finger family protein n=1 Tax=Paenibacillus sanguinis TaxID=225906 RepID=UPI00036AABC1|nr:SWIM zinc finger family protein [Paenibacillus sanguinis]
MIEITAAYADSLAPNSSAIKNGQGLALKKKFVSLHHSPEGDLLFGECSGSGKSNYLTSADFVIPDKPVFRCSCPSRQFPCKHALGLLYAYLQGQTFTESPVPEDIASKREKAEKREEKKQQEATAPPSKSKPKKVNTSALKKKLSAQLEGLDLLERLVQPLIRSGLGTIDSKTLKHMNSQIKELGNYYLPGAQYELRQLSVILASDAEQELRYTQAVEQFTRLHALIKRGRAHIRAKLDNEQFAPDPASTIEEWLGHAWQLSDLAAHGLQSGATELIQLAFTSYDDPARQEYVDTGYWLNYDNKQIHRTIQYRPYRAARHLKEEDSFWEVIQVPALYHYPGDLNHRIRYEQFTSRDVTEQDFARIADASQRSYADVLKTMKNQLKSPLADPEPVVLLHVHETLLTDQGEYVITDESGQQLKLSDLGAAPQGTLQYLPYVPQEWLQHAELLVMFRYESATGTIAVQPLTLIHGQQQIRLLY